MSITVAQSIEENFSQDKYICEVVSTYITLDNNHITKVYGLYLYNSLPYKAHQKNEFCMIADISCDVTEVLNLKSLIEELNVFPVHLRDIVEDYLS